MHCRAMLSKVRLLGDANHYLAVANRSFLTFVTSTKLAECLQKIFRSQLDTMFFTH